MHFDLILRGGSIVLPWGEAVTDLGVQDGRIASLGTAAADTADTVLDCTHLHVLPGLIDPHVHFRDPGDATVETIETGTRGAVLGGITTVFDMPNTSPAITDAATVAWKQAYIGSHAWCDMGFYVGATKGNFGALAGLETAAGVCGVKVFAGSSTGDLLVDDDASIEQVLRHGHRRVCFHSEDEARLQARRGLFHDGDPYAAHAEWRDVECALLGTQRILALAGRTGRPVHILHVSTAEELDLLRQHRRLATTELLVNHLTQWAPDCYDRLGGYAVMNPPLRDRRHMEAAWAAVRDGTADTIGSDHAPHPRAAKERPWPSVAAGLTGVQTLVPLMLDHVAAGRLSLARMVDLMSAGPARVYGVAGKGRIAAGYDADFTVVDLAARRTITNDWIVSPCGWTPFDGQTVTGWPVMTVVRGRVVMRDGVTDGARSGRLAAFTSA